MTRMKGFLRVMRSSCRCSLMIVAIVGCSRGPRLNEVKGTVTIGGTPQKNVAVQFNPVTGGRSADARTNAEGKFVLRYAPGLNGAIVGMHRVRVWAGGERDEDGYVSAEKQLFKGEFEVKPGPNVIDIAIP